MFHDVADVLGRAGAPLATRQVALLGEIDEFDARKVLTGRPIASMRAAVVLTLANR